jgi:hypothetical protein
LLVAQSVAGWTASGRGAVRAASPLIGRCALPRCSTPPQEPDPELPSAFDISREIAKYDSAGFRLRQSTPVRGTTSLIQSVLKGIRAATTFYRRAFASVPFHAAIMLLTAAAYGVQSTAPRAAMLAGARMNSAINAGQWHRLVSPVFLHGVGSHHT